MKEIQKYRHKQTSCDPKTENSSPALVICYLVVMLYPNMNENSYNLQNNIDTNILISTIHNTRDSLVQTNINLLLVAIESQLVSRIP